MLKRGVCFLIYFYLQFCLGDIPVILVGIWVQNLYLYLFMGLVWVINGARAGVLFLYSLYLFFLCSVLRLSPLSVTSLYCGFVGLL